MKPMFCLVVVIALLPLGASGAAGPGRMPDQVARLAVLESTAGRLLIRLEVPRYRLEPVTIGSRRFTRVTAAGLSAAAVGAGGPALPDHAVLVGLPAEGDWSVRVIEAESRTVRLEAPLAPTAPLAGGGLLAESATRGPAVPAENGAAAWWSPLSAITVGEEAWIRGLRIVRLGLHPFRYNLERAELEIVRTLEVEVRFYSSVAGTPVADGWDSLLDQYVINYSVARQWRTTGPVPAGRSAANPPAGIPGSLKIEVGADGLYQLDHQLLQDAGFDVEGDPRYWELSAGGQAVAMQVDGEEDSRFDPGDLLRFYGQLANTRYSVTNVYWLAQVDHAGLRMAERPVDPGGDPITGTTTYTAALHLEENHLYDSAHPEPDGDHWYWTDLRDLASGCPTSVQAYSFRLPHLVTGAPTARLRLGFQGYTMGTHHLTVWVNGHKAGDAIWQDHARWEGGMALNGGWLTAGSNTLELRIGDCPPEGTRPPNGMWVDYYELDYRAWLEADAGSVAFSGQTGEHQYVVSGLVGPVHLLETSDATAPVILTGGQAGAEGFAFQDDSSVPQRYLTLTDEALSVPAVTLDQPSDLVSAAAGANYLAIGYGPFLPALEPLVSLRRDQGWQTAVVDVDDVYDEFSYGVLDPSAIREFLAALHPRPTMVLLVGDGTIDYLDHLGYGWRNFVPVFPANVDPWMVETVTDNRFACVDGSDPLPDLHIGRLAVSSVEETQAVVRKIVGYDTGPTGGNWSRRALFVADDADAGGDYAAASDELVQDYLPAEIAAERVYLTAGADEPHEYEPDQAGVKAARAAIRSRWDAGLLMVTYVGHSSQSQWAIESLLHREQVPLLRNGGRLPVVVALTCYSSAFHTPAYAPLGEQLFLEPFGGAVATWGPTGGGLSSGHRLLGEGFFQAAFGTDLATLGVATMSGKIKVYVGSPLNHYLIDTYVLLGDPASSLPGGEAPLRALVYLPLVLRR